MNQIYNKCQLNSTASIKGILNIPQVVTKEVEVPGPEIIVNNIYSLTPKPIGTWINGKTIYRQVVHDVGHGLDKPFGINGPNEVETYINIKMICYDGIRFYDSNYGVIMLKVNENNVISFNAGTMANTIKDFTKDLIIEYTTVDTT